jgi:hypothetical protein
MVHEFRLAIIDRLSADQFEFGLISIHFRLQVELPK